MKLPSLDARHGRYQTIVADPPWEDPDKKGWPSGQSHQVARPHYRVLSVERLKALPVSKLAARKAHLYLWTTNKHLEPAHGVVRAWGFQPTQVLTWVKEGVGLGGSNGKGLGPNTEHVIVGRRGSLPFRARMGTWLQAPRQRPHSTKPPEMRRLIERMSPGPRLELFARQGAPGWDVWGHQAKTATEPRKEANTMKRNPEIPPQIAGPIVGAVAGGVTGHAMGQAAKRKPGERGSVPQLAAIATAAYLTHIQDRTASLLNPALAGAAVGWLLQGGVSAIRLGLLTPYLLRTLPPLLTQVEQGVKGTLVPAVAGALPGRPVLPPWEQAAPTERQPQAPSSEPPYQKFGELF